MYVLSNNLNKKCQLILHTPQFRLDFLRIRKQQSNITLIEMPPRSFDCKRQYFST